MSNAVAHHPADDMLESFARRESPLGVSAIIAAHGEFCDRCRARVAEFESRQLREWHAGAGAVLPDALDFGGMIERIVAQPRRETGRGETPAAGSPDRFIKDLRLPRALRRAAAGLRWTRRAEGIYQAMAQIDHETRCEFICMAAGGSTPVHTHYGNEYTLVLRGGFRDELGSYGSGDFLARDASHEHRPASETGCLCFAVLDRPLRFTRGMPRLINPINRLLFRRRPHR